MPTQEQAKRLIRYDVAEAARLLRIIATFKDMTDHWYLKEVLKEAHEFLDDICPDCHGAGDYYSAEDEREPCDTCGLWTDESEIVWVLPDAAPVTLVEDF